MSRAMNGGRTSRQPWLRPLLAAAALIGGLALMTNAGWLHAKAALAQVLIEKAWRENLAEGRPQSRPWSWADTMPVGRLEFVRQRESMVVLAGDSGRVLAFGPGHRSDTPLPGAPGNSVISAHRDTHFRVLGRVGTGDLIRVEALDGQIRVYRVEERRVIDMHDLTVTEQHGVDALTLVTCWPLDAVVPGGPERLVVTARRIDTTSVRTPITGSAGGHVSARVRQAS